MGSFGGASTISISSALLMNESGTVWSTCLPVIASTCSRSSAMYWILMDAITLMPASRRSFDILPASRVPRARRIVIGQTVDDTDRGMPADEGIDIERGSAVSTLQRNHFELSQQRLDFARHVRLHRAHDDVLPAFPAAPRLVQHPERLPDS